MWIVSKFKSREYGILYQSLKKTLNEVKIYTPKINIKLKKSSKTFTKLILGNYVFIYHKKFSEREFISSLQNLKGLKHILPSFQYNQNEIEKFINHCKSFEDKNGFLTQGFFNFNKFRQKGYFINGPFSGFIFDILDKRKKRLKISLENIKITLKENSDNLFCSSF